ncbi:MAG: hypothetical protein MUO89_07945 [Dehalococcoidia bacterium]|nr:hypothetical protein [Dehalococcoidia bacterium]
MIKILIVLEEEDGIDFRAYALQISNRSKESPPHAKLQLIETNEAPGADNGVTSRPSFAGFDGSYRFPMPQLRKTLETQQIFMN